MPASFSIKADPARDLIRITMAGFFDIAGLVAAMRRAEIAALTFALRAEENLSRSAESISRENGDADRTYGTLWRSVRAVRDAVVDRVGVGPLGAG